ncbi:Small GTPase like protein [Aduncisulcus paluster]|uniref:Small GTPase like protein n=1 Tax=Aduncisulcus paluster TaxID=2918883 RepID=A0ABQ5JY34_9EUKA|nr:Small GTPase like protein [Aduncisulcus paluster]
MSAAKIVIIGSTGVGKSCIISRLVNGTFPKSVTSTIGTPYFTRRVKSKSGVLDVEIWDTSGQERFHSLIPLFFRGADAVIVVYSVTDWDTFYVAKDWIESVPDEAQNDNIVIYLFGNKTDDKREISEADGVACAKEYGCMFAEGSAMKGEGLDSILPDLAHEISIIKRKTPTKKDDKLDLSKKERKRGCCQK